MKGMYWEKQVRMKFVGKWKIKMSGGGVEPTKLAGSY